VTFGKLSSKPRPNDEHLGHDRSAQTASAMWTCLKKVFQRNSLLNKLAARRRFYTVDMKEDECMLTYINRVRQISDQLKSMDVNIDETVETCQMC
jgi:gag-polypeptide of LTR copia-type